LALLPDYAIFGIVAGIVAIGFGGELFFRRTGVPSFLFLVFVGILLGPITNILSGQSLVPILGVIADLTLLMVVFYSGMDTNIERVIFGGGRVLVQVALYVILSTVAIGLLTHFLLGWNLLEALIFGSIIGGETTAAVVIPLSRSLNLSDNTSTFITIESVLNSILSIVLFTAFIGTYLTGSPNITSAFTIIASNFSVGIVIGGVLALLWLVILNYFKDYKYTYVLTLALVFASYAISTVLGGSGILAALIFGLLLGGYKTLNGTLFRKNPVDIDHLQTQLKTFQGEISFLLETLFFVFLGLTFSINPSQIFSNLDIGLILVSVLLAFRILATSVSTWGSEMGADKMKIVVMCAQGLTPATLAIIAVNDGLPLGPTFLDLVTYVIILTNVVTTAGAFWIARVSKRSEVGIAAGGGDRLN
jgi:potassium/hydrogen antiporter